jgi:hypothetical protein
MNARSADKGCGRRRPRGGERWPHIEEDKEHGDKVKLHREALLCGTHRIHATFVRNEFGTQVLAPAKDVRETNIECAKSKGNPENNKDRQILFHLIVVLKIDSSL